MTKFYRYVLAGIMAFTGSECGKEISAPYIYTSIQKVLCFIDYDVKCKHGKEFTKFIDYETQCHTWFLEKIGGHDVRELKKLDSIAKNCVRIDEH